MRLGIGGIGMGRNNPSVERPLQLRGRNLFGFALIKCACHNRARIEGVDAPSAGLPEGPRVLCVLCQVLS